MGELIDNGLKVGEVGIFLFEVGDYSSIQKSADLVKNKGHELINSLKFNEVDWTIVVKKLDKKSMAERQKAINVSKEEAKKKEEDLKKATKEAVSEATNTKTKAK